MMKRKIFIGLLSICVTTGLHAQFFPHQNCTTALGNAMFGKMDTTHPRGMADNYHTWEPGTVLLVKFMPWGSKDLRDKVKASAKEWEKYANVSFKFLPDDAGFTNIRVNLGKGTGHNSAVGTEANFRGQNESTINFDTLFFADAEYYAAQLKKRGVFPPYNLQQLITEMQNDPNHWNNAELRRVVMHEFGHSLGLLHEQSYPNAVNWKKTDSIYQYYYQTQGWSRQQTDFNVFDVGNQFCTNGTRYDPKSIMHYSIDAWQTTDGYAVANNFELSDGDKTLIAALYPKLSNSAMRVVPKVNVSNFADLHVSFDDERGGLVVRPAFDLQTNSRLGEVYFVVRLTDAQGYFLRTNNTSYNWGGQAAAYLKMNLLPNSKVSYNRSDKDKLELFFPFRQFPELYGQKVKVTFAVFLDDLANNQMDKLMYFSMTNLLQVPLRPMTNSQ
jgi:serralysin